MCVNERQCGSIDGQSRTRLYESAAYRSQYGRIPCTMTSRLLVRAAAMSAGFDTAEKAAGISLTAGIYGRSVRNFVIVNQSARVSRATALNDGLHGDLFIIECDAIFRELRRLDSNQRTLLRCSAINPLLSSVRTKLLSIICSISTCAIFGFTVATILWTDL